MPDIYGKYSLTEAANLLGVTAAFINRVQREAGVGGKIGIKGQPVYFEAHHIESFRRIKILRKIDFSFKEIKEIVAIENRLLSLYSHLTGDADKREGWLNYSLIVHASTKLSRPGAISKSETDPHLHQYITEANKLYPVAREIKRRVNVFQKEIEEVTAVINELAPGWNNILEAFKISFDK